MSAKFIFIVLMTLLNNSGFAKGIHCSISGRMYTTVGETLNVNNMFFVNSKIKSGFGHFTYEIQATDEFGTELASSSTLVYDEALELGPSILNISVKTDGGVLKCSHGIGAHGPILK